jgi:hypothetical protein
MEHQVQHGRPAAGEREDHVVRVWQVVETSALPSVLAQDGSRAQRRRTVVAGRGWPTYYSHSKLARRTVWP